MTALDWSQPIEAVHEDGRVVAVELAGGPHPIDGEYALSDYLDGGWRYFDGDGKHRDPSCPWHIRNRPPEAQ